MKSNGGPPIRADLAGLLAQADKTVLPRKLSERGGPLSQAPGTRLHVGADLGTVRLFPLALSVMEKVASIVLRHVRDWDVSSIVLVGGSSAFQGMAGVVEGYAGIPTWGPPIRCSSPRSGSHCTTRTNDFGGRIDTDG